MPPGIAVVGLPRLDEKSLAGTRCTSATRNIGATARSSFNEMHVFRLGVRKLSGLRRRQAPLGESLDRKRGKIAGASAGDLVSQGERGYRSEERRVGKECRSRWSPD